MSKPSKRPGRAARGIHERVKSQTATLNGDEFGHPPGH